MFKARFFERAADEGDVVARAAAAAGLRHDEGEVVGVVPAGGHGLHQLADRRDRGIAGVVVDVLEARVDGGAVVVLQYLKIIAVVAEDRLENVKMDGTHLGGEDGVARLIHLPGELHPER